MMEIHYFADLVFKVNYYVGCAREKYHVRVFRLFRVVWQSTQNNTAAAR